MRIDLISLEINNFAGYARSQKIHFKKHNESGKITSIVAENRDAGGSNAGGKSTIPLAVLVCICGPKIVNLTNKDLKNWYTPDETTSLIIELLVNDTTLLINRVIGGKLSIKYGDDDWIVGKVDDVQNKIYEILKVTQEQLLYLTNKYQDEFGGFLLKTGSEKRISC